MDRVPAIHPGSETLLIALHKNARTTAAVRAQIAASNEPASVLAQRFGITEQTVYKWKKRDVFAGRSHTAHHLQTALTPAQETMVVHLRRTLMLSLDDLLAVTQDCCITRLRVPRTAMVEVEDVFLAVSPRLSRQGCFGSLVLPAQGALIPAISMLLSLR